jgi:ADP-ribose pyrophosphatase
MQRSRRVHSGRAVQLDIEQVILPNGAEVELEIVRHPGGAAIVAVDDADRVCLLRHFRHAAGGWLWELPAGRLDPGEEPLATAQRELAEEAGITAVRWSGLGRIASSPGVLTERVHLFLARDLRAVGATPEHAECFEVRWVGRAEALRRAVAGEIEDAKTVVGLLRAAAALDEARDSRGTGRGGDAAPPFAPA